MATTMYLNNDKPIPSYIPNNHYQPTLCSHNQPCHRCNPHTSSSCSHGQPCHSCGPSRQHHDSMARQCHAHTAYVSNCHACNMPSYQLTGPTSSFQYCQCYRCQKARREPVLHPAVGLPLGIVTGGLSCAAMGIYRGVTMQRRARNARKMQAEAQASEQAPAMRRISNTSLPLEKTHSGCGRFVVPSPVSAMSSTSEYSNVSEREGANTLCRKPSTGISEIDGAPVEPAPPRYSEVEGAEVPRRLCDKM